MPDTDEFQVIVCGNDLCSDGKPHDWSGERTFTDERGCTTSTAVCVRCGLAAIDHDMLCGE